MLKTFYVALREFTSTVFTKGFLLGVLMLPVIMAVAVGGIALVKNLKGPQLVGTIAVLDRAGGVGEGVKARFSKESLEKEKKELTQKIGDMAKEKADQMGLPPGQTDQAVGIAGSAIEQSFSKSDLSVELLPADADIDAAKLALADVNIHRKSDEPGFTPPRVAVAIIPQTTVKPGPDGKFEKFEIYTAPKLDQDILERIERKIGEAIVDARVASDERLKASGLNADAVRALVSQPDAKSATMTKQGEQKSTGIAQMMLPMAFMALLLMSVMTGGQYLLTTTVEEKSSRVMEVLLSAVSPKQLMVGKIIGQMCVGLVILMVYSGIGVAGLVVFSFQHLLDPMLLVYMFIFFFIAFFIIASMMAAVGSAVSEMREAQTMMTPIMTIIMLPWLLWLPISRAPNSMFATIMSFTPGINPFVMMIRLTGSEPPPRWQIPVAILVGLLTVLFCAWAAGKIFRIGVLLYGKPPNLRTLIKWVRMA